jgi:hypothetical protein
MRKSLVVAVVAVLLSTSAALAERMPAEWDGLVKVDSRHFDGVYLAPGADFSGFTRVMLDPTDVSFRRDWLRNYNNSTRGAGGRISDAEALEMLQAAQEGFQDVFAEEFTKAGYQIVTTPAPDVMRVRTAVVNLDIAAPDPMEPGRTYRYSRDAGEATVVIEVRDSMSGAILGRGIDRRTAGDNDFMMRRTSGTNRGDFSRMFRRWAELSAEGLTQLRATPPIPSEAPVN